MILLFGVLSSNGEDASFGVRLFSVRETYRSFEEFEMKLQTDDLRAKGSPVKTAEVEIRDSGRKLRILRFPYVWSLQAVDDQRRLRLANASSDFFSEAILRRLTGVQPGQYDVALLINGVRASNVGRVRIDPAHDASSDPALRLGVIEAPPGADKAQLIVRVHVPPHEKFTAEALIATPILVDGIERKPRLLVWTGPIPELKPGSYWYFLPDLDQYEPVIEPKLRHRYEITASPAAAIEFDAAEKTLGKEWDRTTSELTDRATPPALLTGTVIDSGAGAEAYEVSLSNEKGERFVEFTDENNGFRFPGVPPGVYTVSCGVLNGADYGYSKAEPETIELKAAEPVSLTLRFRTWKTQARHVLPDEK